MQHSSAVASDNRVEGCVVPHFGPSLMTIRLASYPSQEPICEVKVPCPDATVGQLERAILKALEDAEAAGEVDAGEFTAAINAGPRLLRFVLPSSRRYGDASNDDAPIYQPIDTVADFTTLLSTLGLGDDATVLLDTRGQLVDLPGADGAHVHKRDVIVARQEVAVVRHELQSELAALKAMSLRQSEQISALTSMVQLLLIPNASTFSSSHASGALSGGYNTNGMGSAVGSSQVYGGSAAAAAVGTVAAAPIHSDALAQQGGGAGSTVRNQREVFARTVAIDGSNAVAWAHLASLLLLPDDDGRAEGNNGRRKGELGRETISINGVVHTVYDCLVKSLSLNANNPSAWTSLGNHLAELSFISEGVPPAGAAAAGGTKSARGVTAAVSGVAYTAADCYAKTVELAPTAAAWRLVGAALLSSAAGSRRRRRRGEGPATVTINAVTYSACACCTAALELDPSVAEGWRMLAQSMDATDGATAVRPAAPTPAPTPTPAPAVVAQEATVVVSGASYTRIACALKALALDDMDGRNWKALGDAMGPNAPPEFVNNTRPFSKMQCYVRALECDAADVSAWGCVAELVVGDRTVQVCGAHCSKIECCAQAVMSDRSSPLAWKRLGDAVPYGESVVLFNTEAFTKNRCYARALAFDFDLSDAWLALSRGLFMSATIDIDGRSFTKDQCVVEYTRCIGEEEQEKKATA